MIASFLFTIIALIVQMAIYVVALLSAGVFTNSVVSGFMSKFETIFDWLFGSLLYFNGILAIDELLQAIGFVITFMTWVYGIKLAFWAWSLTPWSVNSQAPFKDDNDKRVTVT